MDSPQISRRRKIVDVDHGQLLLAGPEGGVSGAPGSETVRWRAAGNSHYFSDPDGDLYIRKEQETYYVLVELVTFSHYYSAGAELEEEED